jgi:hypothetical protein
MDLKQPASWNYRDAAQKQGLHFRLMFRKVKTGRLQSDVLRCEPCTSTVPASKDENTRTLLLLN